jgi:molecular chaperone DnaK (HSP70)
MGKVIGIDFGTTNVRMAVWQQGNHIEIIPNDRGMYSTASFVAFPDDKILVGDAAMERISIHPRQTYAP